MANAVPNAFGAQLAYPGRQTIALSGDGGFTMLGLGDLPTLVQRKARVVHVILNNESLDFVNIEQQEAGMVPFGVEFKNPNFARVAEAMGAKGIRLEEPGDVKEAIAEALAYKDGPVVLDAVVDPFRALVAGARARSHSDGLHLEPDQAGAVWALRLGDQDDGTQRSAGLRADAMIALLTFACVAGLR